LPVEIEAIITGVVGECDLRLIVSSSHLGLCLPNEAALGPPLAVVVPIVEEVDWGVRHWS